MIPATARVGLQAIHTPDRQVVAYELLYRGARIDGAFLTTEAEHDRATAQVISATFAEFGVDQLANGHLLFLNATRSFLTGGLPLPFGPEGVVLELLEHVTLDGAVVAGLQQLSERGFALAVDDFDGAAWRLPAVLHADYVKLDLQAVGEHLTGLIELVRRINPSARIVVERVETEDQFELCRSLGVDLFQGYLLHRPDVAQRRTLSPSHLICARLLALLATADSPLDHVVDVLAEDPGLSLRVLKRVSAAAFAPRQGIESLRHALVLLGREELLAWVTLAMLEVGQDQAVPSEAVSWLFTRADACRLLDPSDGEAAFTVGLLSAAAEALAVDPVELVRGCALRPEVSAALAGGGSLGGILREVREHERFVLSGGRVHRVSEADAGVAGVSSGLSEAYLTAVIMARARAASINAP